MIENRGNPLPTLDVQIYAEPARCTPAGFIRVEAKPLRTLTVTGIDASLMEVSFEDVGRQLAAFERCYFEPDGCFVWTGERQGVAWQLDGMLYDRADRVQRVELRGTCPRSTWLCLLTVLGAPNASHIAFVRPQNCFVHVDELLSQWIHDA